jgi:hypothetical protein
MPGPSWATRCMRLCVCRCDLLHDAPEYTQWYGSVLD